MDSTLIQNEMIDLMAEAADVQSDVAAITAAAMAGELDFEQALRARVRLLAGIDESAIEDALGRIIFTPGARTFTRTLRRLGYNWRLSRAGSHSSRPCRCRVGPRPRLRQLRRDR